MQRISVDAISRRVIETPKPALICVCGDQIVSGTMLDHWRSKHRGAFKEDQ